MWDFEGSFQKIPPQSCTRRCRSFDSISETINKSLEVGTFDAISRRKKCLGQ